MLNPNSKDLENANQNIVVSDQPVETNAAYKTGHGLSSRSPSLGGHCHVSEKTDKIRNKSVLNKLIAVFILGLVFMNAEIVGGILAQSISIQTDAAHLAVDLTGFLFSIVAVYVSRKEPTHRMTFGYYRIEILGSLCSILLIWLLTGLLVYFAIIRIITNDYDIEPVAMITTASCAVLFNLVMFIILHTNIFFGDDLPIKHRNHSHSHDVSNHVDKTLRVVSNNTENHKSVDQQPYKLQKSDSTEFNKVEIVEISSKSSIESSDSYTNHHTDHKHSTYNINLRAASIHVIGDFIQSVGVLIAALIIYFEPDYKIADPICTFLFSFLVILTTIPIVRDIYFVLMEGFPINLNYDSITSDLCALKDVKGIHNLHIWSLTMDKFALAVHLATESNADSQQVLREVNIMLRSKYNIEETIIQVESYAGQE